MGLQNMIRVCIWSFVIRVAVLKHMCAYIIIIMLYNKLFTQIIFVLDFVCNNLLSVWHHSYSKRSLVLCRLHWRAEQRKVQNWIIRSKQGRASEKETGRRAICRRQNVTSLRADNFNLNGNSEQ